MAAIKEVGDRLDGKPAQAVAIAGDPDSPVIFNLRLGDGLKTIDGGAVTVAQTRASRLIALSNETVIVCASHSNGRRAGASAKYFSKVDFVFHVGSIFGKAGASQRGRVRSFAA